MLCLDCGAIVCEGDQTCATCRAAEGTSVLKALSQLCEIVERTSIEDFALFCIALNRRDQQKEA